MGNLIPRALISVGVFVFFFAVAGAQGSASTEFKFPERNFESPEAAIRHFVERLSAKDLSGAFEACAINEGDRFDFVAYSKRIQSMVLVPSVSLAPAQSKLFAEINRISRLGLLSNQVKNMIYSLLTDEVLDGKTIVNPDSERVAAFVERCDPERLAGLSVVKITLPVSGEIVNSERARKNDVERARIYGADDSTERIVLYRLGDVWYWGGVSFLKYGNFWRINVLVSAFANTSALGVLEKTTPEAFGAMGE